MRLHELFTAEFSAKRGDKMRSQELFTTEFLFKQGDEFTGIIHR